MSSMGEQRVKMVKSNSIPVVTVMEIELDYSYWKKLQKL